MSRVPQSSKRSPLGKGLGVLVLALMTAGTAACRDESDPLTFVKDLDDLAKSTGAVRRLKQFYEDAMTVDKKDRKGPAVKAFHDKVLEPLTKACTDNTTLQKQARSDLIALLADARDARTAACMAKVLNDHKPGETESDVQAVMRGIAQSKLEGWDPAKAKEVSDAAVKVFAGLKVSDAKAALIYRDVNDAVLAIANTGHQDTFIKLIERPIEDTKNIPVYKSELFWQTVSAQALGNIKSDKAVPALMKLTLSPTKADMANTALIALVRIGKPVVPVAEALLNSKEEALVTYSKEENMKGVDTKDAKRLEAIKKEADKAHVAVAAQILGALGREDSIKPLMDALASADEPTKAVIALQLPNVPKSDATVTAFKDVFDKTKNDTSLPGGGAAKESMLDASGGFFDSNLVPWMLANAQAVKGEQDAVDSIRSKTLEVVMKLMTDAQVAQAEQLYNMKGQLDGKPSEIGKAYEKEFKAAKELVGECKQDVDCYLKVMADTKSQDKDGQFKGIKAGYMVAALGGDDVKAKLLANMNKFTNAAVRFVAVSVLDSKSPKGDADLAAKLQDIVDKAEAAKDQELMQANAPFKQVIARLRARAQ